jgi:hypothetical protein
VGRSSPPDVDGARAGPDVDREKLQSKDSKERLAAGADDKAPPEYQKQVDAYFKAIAAKKKGS